MKRIIIQVIIFIVTAVLFSSDGSLNAGPVHGKNIVEVYAAGLCETMHTPSPGYWKNWKWIELPVPDFAYAAVAASVVTSGTDIYVSGHCLTTRRKGLSEVPGYWKNGTWTAVTVPEQAMGSVIISMAISGNDIIVRGYCIIRSGSSMVNVPGCWKNGSWFALAVPEGSKRSEITSLKVSGNDVYAGGWCEYRSGDGEGVFNSVPVYWKNGTWKKLPVPGICNISEVTSLFISGEDVYAGGRCLKTGTGGYGTLIYMPGYWKNGTWSALNDAGSRLHFSAHSKSVSIYTAGNDIYAVEYAVINSDIEDPGYWKNGAWKALTLSGSKESSYVTSMAVSGNNVYAGGYTIMPLMERQLEREFHGISETVSALLLRARHTGHRLIRWLFQVMLCMPEAGDRMIQVTATGKTVNGYTWLLLFRKKLHM